MKFSFETKTNISKEKIQEKSSESSIDTKKLTEDQAITWVKNYLLSQGATNEEIDEAGFQTQLSNSGYLEISMYTWTPAHMTKTLAYIYRVNDSGELQEGSIYNDDSWTTISTDYIE